MKLTDRIYGIEEVEEEVLIELINSRLVQRLKSISQMGMPQEYYGEKVFSRYEHSIGVLILLRRLGASIDEQVAGLLHDVSHTAFSHVIDWVLGDPVTEGYQDNAHEATLNDGEMRGILDKHGFDYKEIADLEKYTLLESEIPSICADRFDYSLREISEWASKDELEKIIGAVVNSGGKMIFNDKEAAELFAIGYMKCQTEHWAGADAKARYHILAEILKSALKLSIICVEDFKKTDNEVIELLLKSEDAEIIRKLKLLRGKLNIRDGESGIVLVKKLRYVDPDVIDATGSGRKLSEISGGYALKLKEMLMESALVKRFVVEGYLP